jgi:hypothetical protein
VAAAAGGAATAAPYPVGNLGRTRSQGCVVTARRGAPAGLRHGCHTGRCKQRRRRPPHRPTAWQACPCSRSPAPAPCAPPSGRCSRGPAVGSRRHGNARALRRARAPTAAAAASLLPRSARGGHGGQRGAAHASEGRWTKRVTWMARQGAGRQGDARAPGASLH